MKKVNTNLLITFTLFFLASSMFGQSFKTKVDFTGGGSPYGIVSADFNGDNITDFAEVNLNNSTVSVFINKTAPADSGASYYPKVDIVTDTSPADIVAADFNLDGMIDLAICVSGANKITLLLNTTFRGGTTPSFTAQTFLVTGSLPYALATGDFNLDGKSDIVVTNSKDNTVSVFLNKTVPGQTTFTFASASNLTTGNNPQAVKVADFNGDYKDDIVVANYSGNSLSFFLNKMLPGSQTASFEAKQDQSTITGPTTMAVGDMDSDGIMDLVALGKTSKELHILFNYLNNPPVDNTKIRFLSYYVRNLKETPSAIALDNINGDGFDDIIVTFAQDGLVGVVFGNSGSFKDFRYFGTGTAPAAISVADVNRDGLKDLLIANTSSNTISCLYNEQVTYFNSIEFSSKMEYDTQGQGSDIASADLNGDGKMDIAVSNWEEKSVSVFMNLNVEGATIPKFGSRKDYPILSIGSDIELADINNDGKPDIIASNWGDSISVLINTTPFGDTSSSFNSPINFNTGYQAGPDAVAIGDLNSDGKLDIVVSNQFPDINSKFHISVLINETEYGNATPKFTTQTSLPSAEAPWEVKIADFDLDGKKDIIVVNFTSGSISVFPSLTNVGETIPAFSQKNDFAVGRGTAGLDIADLNGDGTIDAVVANQNSDSVAILMNNTPVNSVPYFGPLFGEKTEFGPNFVKLKDLDGNGRPELLVTNGSYKNVISIFYNNSSVEESKPYFGDMTNFAVDSLPVALVAEDFNSDGKIDIATVNQVGKSITVLFNTSTLTSVKDVSDEIIAREFTLSQNYPNPFNPSTKIEFSIPAGAKSSLTQLAVFDILGRKVATLVNEIKAPGKYEVTLDASSFASGVYFYRLINGINIQTKKMILMK